MKSHEKFLLLLSLFIFVASLEYLYNEMETMFCFLFPLSCMIGIFFMFYNPKEKDEKNKYEDV